MSEWQRLKEKLTEFEADPLGCVAYLAELRDLCRKGVEQQKIMVGKEGSMVVDLLERYPDLELRATQEMLKAYQYVVKQAEAEAKEQGDGELREVNIRISRYTGD